MGEALDEFHQAMRFAAEQKEIALICQYEIGEFKILYMIILIALFIARKFLFNHVLSGWCHMLRLEWEYALPAFFRYVLYFHPV